MHLAADFKIQPNPLVIHKLCHVLHYVSVVYEIGALLQIVLFETQFEAVELVPEHGPSAAVIIAHESIVPVNAEQFDVAAMHPVVPFHTQFFTLLTVGNQVSQAASVVAMVFN